jgi:hypothetical protein
VKKRYYETLQSCKKVTVIAQHNPLLLRKSPLQLSMWKRSPTSSAADRGEMEGSKGKGARAGAWAHGIWNSLTTMWLITASTPASTSTPCRWIKSFKGEKILIKLFCTTNWTMIFKSLHQHVSKLIMPDSYFIPFTASQLLIKYLEWTNGSMCSTYIQTGSKTKKEIKHCEVVTMSSDYCGQWPVDGLPVIIFSPRLTWPCL